MENVAIIGSGIAGLTAAIYTARANLKPIAISGKAEGGQLMLTTEVENYPGFPEGIMGPELMSKAREQAKRFGARFIDGDAEKVEKKDSGFVITTSEGKIEAKAVIIATGASSRMIGLESEKKYWARGVHTCATCDGYFYKEKDVVVVGGGDSAMEESLFLAKHASKVTIIHRRDKLRASKIMQEKIKANSKISVIWDSVVEEIMGDGKKVNGIKIKNVKTGKAEEMKIDAVFLAIGHVPNTGFLKGIVEMDAQGFVKTDGTKTSVPGLFAAGDVQDPIYKQAVTAAGSGCRAALEAEKHVEGK